MFYQIKTMKKVVILSILGLNTTCIQNSNYKHTIPVVIEEIDYTSLKEKYNFKEFTDSNCNFLSQIAKKHNIKEVEWLFKLIWLESRGNPKAVNPKTYATGLIQFMPKTATKLGTSVFDLYYMNIENQLKYMDKYLEKFLKGKQVNNFTDLYLVIFYPYAITKEDNYIIGMEKSAKYAEIVAQKNKIYDINNDGFITKYEVDKAINL